MIPICLQPPPYLIFKQKTNSFISDHLEEKLVDVDIIVVVSVTIFISSVLNTIILEAEIPDSLMSTNYKKRPMDIIIYLQQGNFYKTIKA